MSEVHPATVVGTSTSECEGGSYFRVGENATSGSTCLKSSVVLCHFPNRGRDLTSEHPSLAFLDNMSGNVPARQHQSKFFQLCRELRDEIYSLVLTSHSSEAFVRGAACECVNCDDRRRLPVGTSIAPGSSSPIRRETRSAIVNVFRVCRRIYNEARPVLQQVNSLYIDGRGNVQHYLFDLSTSFYTHRGIILPTVCPRTISIPINLVFSINHHLNHTSSNNSSSEFQIFKNFNVALGSMPPLHIRKLNISIRQSRQTQIADYVPLLRALIKFLPVNFGTVTIEVDKSLTRSETDILAAIATDLTAALHTAPSLTNHVISAFDAFKNAKTRVQQAITNNEACHYTAKLELEQLRNFILDDGLRASAGYLASFYNVDRESHRDYEDNKARAREEFELSLMFGDVLISGEGNGIEVA